MILEKEFTNWRRYILVGYKKDIRKYLDESPICDENIEVRITNMKDFYKNYNLKQFPDCIRGLNLQSSNIILINFEDRYYNYFKDQTKEVMQIYPTPKMSPRIYKVEV